MNPGNLDRLIAIQKLTETRGSDGSVVPAWSVADNVWAQKLSTSGREAQAAASRHADVDQVFRIRYYDGLSEKSHRIVFDGRIYDIVGIAEEGRRASQVVTCKFTEGRP